MSETFVKTNNALGDDLFTLLSQKKYCIVGCGGIGANFAEMLARSGAKHINLIDRDIVELSNLNRVFSFSKVDKGKLKTEVIRNKLKSINPSIDGKDSNFFFADISDECSDKDREKLQRSRDIVCDSDIVGIFCDNNRSRISLERLCSEQNNQHISAAIEIDPKGTAFFECGWGLQTPKEKIDDEGYANNASLAPIIMEATSVAFSMLLANLGKKSSPFYRYTKTYKAFVPTEIKINGELSYSKDCSKNE